MSRPRIKPQVARIMAMLSLLIAVTPGSGWRSVSSQPAAGEARYRDHGTWFEKGNTIVDASVCREYCDDSQRYQLCRQRARELFQHTCREATPANRRSEMPDPKLRAEMKNTALRPRPFSPDF